MLKQRDARKQEIIQQELEHIKLSMGEEAGFNSEDECHQVEIVANDTPLHQAALAHAEDTDEELSNVSVSTSGFLSSCI